MLQYPGARKRYPQSQQRKAKHHAKNSAAFFGCEYGLQYGLPDCEAAYKQVVGEGKSVGSDEPAQVVNNYSSVQPAHCGGFLFGGKKPVTRSPDSDRASHA